MTDRELVQELVNGRAVVELDHPRQRTDGVIGVYERGGAVVVLCAHRCELTELHGVAGLRELERLDLGGNRLTALPMLPASLRELYVDDNQLARLPELPRLRVLDANRNQLVEVSAIEDVDVVYLASNRLASPPVLVNARYVNLNGNPLARIDTLGDGALAELRIEDAALRELPVAMRGLAGLRELHLRGNAIETIPAWLGELDRLEVLDLRGNRLDDLPETVGGLPLRKLDLRWNPLRRPPPWLAALRARGCLVYC